jgi:hypothetical protein
MGLARLIPLGIALVAFEMDVQKVAEHVAVVTATGALRTVPNRKSSH